MKKQSSGKKCSDFPLYKLGKMFLIRLLYSGEALVTGPFCFSSFLFDQIERNLNDKIGQSGEDEKYFKSKFYDFTSLGLHEYRVDLSQFDFLKKYNKAEEEQWIQAGFDIHELNRLRDEYLYGDIWSDQDKKNESDKSHNRPFVVSAIDSYAFDFADMLEETARLNNIPLMTVISIYKGMVFGRHSDVELFIYVSDQDKDLKPKLFDITKRINMYFGELISAFALLLVIEFLWIVGVINDNMNVVDPVSSIREFFVKSSFSICLEDQIRCMSDIDLKTYIKDRFCCIFSSYFIFIELLSQHFSSKGKIIARKSFDDAIIFNSSKLGMAEKKYLGEAFSRKLAEKLALHTYHLQGKHNNILYWIITILTKLVATQIVQARDKNTDRLSSRTLARYKEEKRKELANKKELTDKKDEVVELTKGDVYTRYVEKQKEMHHSLDGHLSQNQLIEIVLLAPDKEEPEERSQYHEKPEPGSEWHKDIVNQGIALPDLSRRGFADRLNKLQKQGKLSPDKEIYKGKSKHPIKYYRIGTSRFREIAKLIAAMDDK